MSDRETADLCLCGSTAQEHLRGGFSGCEYWRHHCDACHDAGACTAASCALAAARSPSPPAWRKEPPHRGGHWAWRDGDGEHIDAVPYLADLDNGSQPGPLLVSMDKLPTVPLPEFLREYPDSQWCEIAPLLKAAPSPPALVEAACELAAAQDAAKAADRARAKADHKAFSGGKPLPKRPGKNAVFLHDLPPEEQQRIKERCEREMAPVIEEGRNAAAAKERLDRAWAALRAALDKEPTP